MSSSARPHPVYFGFFPGRSFILRQAPPENLDEFLRDIVQQCRVELTNSYVERAPERSHVPAIQYDRFGSLLKMVELAGAAFKAALSRQRRIERYRAKVFGEG